jgi:hypothetical protein
MPADVLGAALHNSVRAQSQRPLEVRRGKGVVHSQPGPRLMGDLVDLGDIAHCHGGIGWRLQEDQPRALPQPGFYLFRLGGVHKADLDSEFGEN